MTYSAPTPATPRGSILDAFERVVVTYVEVFLGTLILSSSGAIDLSTARSAALAGIPAAVAALKAAITHLVGSTPRPRSPLLDLAERALSTYLETFLGVLMVASAYGLSQTKVALLAALPAGLAVVKGGLATLVPGTATPASLAPAPVSFTGVSARPPDETD